MKPTRLQRFVREVTPPFILRGLFGVTFGIPGADTWEFAQAWARGLTTDSTQLKEPYAKSAVLATALSRVAEDAASVPWELFSAGASDDEDPLESHPLLDLWAAPNELMSGLDLWIYTYLCFKLYGEAFWYYPDLRIGTRGGLRATEKSSGGLGVLDPRMVIGRVVGGEIRWTLRLSGQEVPLDPDRLTQFKRANPYDPVRGLSEIDAIRVEIEADYHAVSWNRDFFAEQNGIPSGALIPHVEDRTPKVERDDYIRRMQLQHRSGKRSIAAIPPGWDWKELGVSQKDMEFRALREYSREQILALTGVPPFLAGVLDKANYANAREQKGVYWQGTITRLLTAIQGTINHDFLPKVGVTDVEAWPCWEVVKALLEDLTEKVAVAEKLFGMGFTKRQINERLELGFDVDELEDADVGYLPFTVAPVSMLSEPRSVAGPVAEEDAEADDADETQRGLRLVRRDSADMREQRRALVWRNIIVRTRDIESRFNAAIRRHMREIETEALAFVGGIKGWILRQGSDSSPIFDVPAAKARLQNSTEPIHRSGMTRGAESVLAELRSGVDWNIDDPVAAAKLAELQHKITRIDDTIEAELRKSLGEGVAAGESPQQLAKRVSQVMDASKSRSFTIARTETGFAFNTGRNSAMQQAGVDRHEWLTARDSNVRDPHAAEDGNVTSIGEPFPVTHLLYPLDPSGPAAQVINCRCVALPVVR